MKQIITPTKTPPAEIVLVTFGSHFQGHNQYGHHASYIIYAQILYFIEKYFTLGEKDGFAVCFSKKREITIDIT